MDHRSKELMDDVVLEQKNQLNQQSSSRGATKNEPAKTFRGLKVELQTVRLSDESEKQLYDTLKFIYGNSFKLNDISQFEKKSGNLHREYWMKRGNLIIRDVIDYSSKELTPLTNEKISKNFALSRLETYSFHLNHCNEALDHTDGDVGKALELLFEKYYQVNKDKLKLDDDVKQNDLLDQRNDEKLVLESIYGNMFEEKIKNQLWVVKLKLDYLVKGSPIDCKEKKKEVEKNRDICRLYLANKCRFGIKCRFLHTNPEKLKNAKKSDAAEDPYFILEIRFPEENQYPYQSPYFYFYKCEMSQPDFKYLTIVKRLYEEAVELSKMGEPFMYSLISLLENSDEILPYLKNSEESFISKYDSIFQNEIEVKSQELSTHYELKANTKNKRMKVSLEELLIQDDKIYSNFMEKQNKSSYLRMIENRKKLPAWSMKNEVLQKIGENQVVIICGETGCGKSTQIPQFILDDWITNYAKSKKSMEIICTQPRQLSAIGVAERVASERDERVGYAVGYQIRLEKKISAWTRLTFCTIGILLQRLISDNDLESVNYIIVDEVHERSADNDLLLMLLKNILLKRPDFKIILMSATFKQEVFLDYFQGAPIISIPGRTFPVEQIFIEDIIERTGYVLEENSKYTRKIRGGWENLQNELESADFKGLVVPKDAVLDENLNLSQLIGRYPGYSKQTYKNLYVMDHSKINYELIEKILEWIIDGEHDYPRQGSILIFLPGIQEILTLKDNLNVNKILSSKTGKFLILPLHSSLSSEEQNLIFKKPKEGVRKIIISTNIAETSITIDDCVFVIDSGKMKEKRFNSNQNMESLETCWVTRANAIQRKGRAGRVMPGVSIHLYTSKKFQHYFTSQPISEILRIPLDSLILKVQVIHQESKSELYNLFKRLIEPPEESSIDSAISRLKDVGAFDSECNLTPLGHHLAALPVDVRIGKLILYGAIFNCLDSALSIAACLSYKTPFSMNIDKRQDAISKKKEFITAFSDQLTTLKAYNKWLEIYAKNPYAANHFARNNYLSIKTLKTLADLKHQFLEHLVSIGFVCVDLKRRVIGVDKVLEYSGPEVNVNNENCKLLQGLLCAALYPNVAKIFTPEKSFEIQSSGAIPKVATSKELKFQIKKDEFVNIHPTSVNFSVGQFPHPYLVFQEKIKTSKVFIREISLVSMLPLVLFSGYGADIEILDGDIILSLADGWIHLAVESHTVAQLLQQMRIELVKLLELKMQDPLLNLVNHQNGRKIIQTIVDILNRD